MVRAVMVLVVWKSLKSQENRKARNCLSPKNRPSQENSKAKNRKNHQKVEIYLILTLRIAGQAF